MKTACPRCRARYDVPERKVGTEVRCKKCSAALVVTADGLRPRPQANGAPDRPFEFEMPLAPAAPPRRRAKSRPAADRDDDREDDRDEMADDLREAAPPSPLVRAVGDFAAFRTMVTPAVIQVVFWLGAAGLVASGVLTMVGSFTAPAVPAVDLAPGIGVPAAPAQPSFSLALFLSGLLTAVVGPLAWRMACEALIVFFRILTTLQDIRAGQAGRRR